MLLFVSHYFIVKLCHDFLSHCHFFSDLLFLCRIHSSVVGIKELLVHLIKRYEGQLCWLRQHEPCNCPLLVWNLVWNMDVMEVFSGVVDRDWVEELEKVLKQDPELTVFVLYSLFRFCFLKRSTFLCSALAFCWFAVLVLFDAAFSSHRLVELLFNIREFLPSNWTVWPGSNPFFFAPRVSELNQISDLVGVFKESDSHSLH